MESINIQQNNNIFKFSIEDGYAKLIQSNIQDPIAIIPSVVEYNNTHYEVKKIGSCAFAKQQNLKYIVFSDGIEELEDTIFAYCGSLMTIVFPNTLKTFGAILWNCPQYENNDGGMILYKGNKEEWTKLRNNCTLKGMDYTPYEEVTRFVSVNYEFSIPEFDYRICTNDINQQYAELRLCNAKGEVTIPDTYVDENGNVFPVKSIGTNAFANNCDIEKVIIPSSISWTNRDSFYGCTHLKEVYVLKDNIDFKFGNGTFFGCNELKKIVLYRPTKFGQYALHNLNPEIIPLY